MCCRNWIFVSPVEGFIGSASASRRKCTRPNPSPATIVLPSGAITQLCMGFSPVKVATSFPLSRFQSRNVPSGEADTAWSPSDVTAMAKTLSVWPSSVRSVLPLFRSQSRGVYSRETETARRPSGVTATAQTDSKWPSSAPVHRVLSLVFLGTVTSAYRRARSNR
jgi:hypothetical protein